MPLFLLAGERSASGWNLAASAKAVALDYLMQKNVGQMTMLEQHSEFCRIVMDTVTRIHQA